jgi:hypothetical protein
MSGQLHGPASLPHGEGAPLTHYIAGWVGPRLYGEVNVLPYRKSNSDPSVIQHVDNRYIDGAIAAIL